MEISKLIWFPSLELFNCSTQSIHSTPGIQSFYAGQPYDEIFYIKMFNFKKG